MGKNKIWSHRNLSLSLVTCTHRFAITLVSICSRCCALFCFQCERGIDENPIFSTSEGRRRFRGHQQIAKWGCNIKQHRQNVWLHLNYQTFMNQTQITSCHFNSLIRNVLVCKVLGNCNPRVILLIVPKHSSSSDYDMFSLKQVCSVLYAFLQLTGSDICNFTNAGWLVLMLANLEIGICSTFYLNPMVLSIACSPKELCLIAFLWTDELK